MMLVEMLLLIFFCRYEGMQDKEESRSENLSLVRRMIDVDSIDDVVDSNVDSYDSDIITSIW